MPIESVASLIDALRHYRLLESAQLDEVTKTLQPKLLEPRLLARELVQRGWLTPYQINQLFQGKAAELVLGSYVVLERLGEGGMGQVFKARHQKLGRTVAIKIIRRDRLGNAEAQHRFRREILVAAQLSHPHVVHSYDADQIGDRHLIVMEYVDGIDLSRLVRQRGPLPIGEACEYIRQAALGLQHAHDHALVHRDIKPSNLLLAQAHGPLSVGLVKILDLGLARVMSVAGDDTPSQVTQDGSLVGTPDYIAPEQARNAHSADIRSDLYSLGCTLFYLITGQPPFPGGSMTEKLLKHHWDAPPTVESLRGDVPPIVAAIVRKLMAKKPEQRFQTPRELAETLAKVVAPGGLQAAVPAELAAPPNGPPTATALPLALPSAIELATPQAMAHTPTSHDTPVAAPAALPVKKSISPQRRHWFIAIAVTGLVFAITLASFITFRARPRDTLPVLNRPSTSLAPAEGQSSSLDRLSKDSIPASERMAGQPRELVAVLGEHRGRHYDSARGVAFSPDGLTLASAGEDGFVRLWAPTTLQAKGALKGSSSGFSCIAYAADGKTLAAGEWNGNVRIWDMTRKVLGEPIVLRHPQSSVQALAFAPDGESLVVVTDDQTAQIWGLRGNDKPTMGATLEGHEDELTTVAFAPNGRFVATGSKDKTARVYEISGLSPTERGVLRHNQTLTALAFAPDSRTLASGDEGGTLRLWEVGNKTGAKGAPLELRSHITALTFAGDKQTLLCGLADSSIAICKLGPTPRESARLQQVGAVRALAWSAKAELIASASESGIIRLWDYNGGQPRERGAPRGHAARISGLAFAADGHTLASASPDSTVRLWELNGLEPQGRAVLPSPGGHAAVAFNPDSKRLAASGRWDCQTHVWDLPSTVPRKWPGSYEEGTLGGAVAFLDNKTLAVGGQDADKQGVVRLLNVQPGDLQSLHVFRGPDAKVSSIAISPDGKLLAAAGGSDDPVVLLWDLSDRTRKQPLHRFAGTPRGSVGPVAFSPSGDNLAYGSVEPSNRRDGSTEHLVRLWNITATPRKLDPLPGHTASVQALAYAPNGQLLATADEEGRLILWDPNGSKNLHDWRFPGAIHSLAFAPDSRHLAVGNGNGTVYILRLKAGPARPAGKL